MSWYDRDYARPTRAPRPRMVYSPISRRSLYGESIVTLLIVANVAVFLLDGMTGFALTKLGAMQTDAVLHGQVWRLITSQYLHAQPGIWHILMNMVGLYFLGGALEQAWGRRKFFAVYTLAGLAGNLFFLLLGLLNWASREDLAVGASGCILGLLGAAAVMFPRAEVYVYFFIPVRIRDAAILFTLLYAYNIWTRGVNFGGDAAHLAGLAFGVWYATIGDRWWTARGPKWRGWFRNLPGRSKSWGPAKAPSFQERRPQRAADAELLDRLLAKVYDSGLHSLTPQERRALTEATERQRQRETEWGRVDRL